MWEGASMGWYESDCNVSEALDHRSDKSAVMLPAWELQFSPCVCSNGSYLSNDFIMCRLWTPTINSLQWAYIGTGQQRVLLQKWDIVGKYFIIQACC